MSDDRYFGGMILRDGATIFASTVNCRDCGGVVNDTEDSKHRHDAWHDAGCPPGGELQKDME